MRDQIDVHKVRERYDHAVRHLKPEKSISERNRRAILRCVWNLQAQGITLTRLLKYLNTLPKIARGLKKDFDKATPDDIKQFVADLNRSKYADWTKSDFKIALKRFYRWLKQRPKDEDAPETSWIKIGNGLKRVLPEELLTEDKVAKMLEVCENSRDRALLLCLDETGDRISELLNLRRKHVQFDEYGATLIVSGKTGAPRVRVIAVGGSFRSACSA